MSILLENTSTHSCQKAKIWLFCECVRVFVIIGLKIWKTEIDGL